MNVTFEENRKLEFIGSYAFHSCKMTAISIPSTVKCIGENAFSECRSLSDIIFVDNSQLINISNHAFYCTNISSIIVPRLLVSIGNISFELSNLKQMVFPSDCYLSEIGSFAFSKTQLKSIEIPNTVKQIGEYAFYHLNLDSISFSNNSQYKEIGTKTFAGISYCSFTFPNVTIISKEAFSKSNIKSILIPSTVTIIDDAAFIESSIEMIIFESNSQLMMIGDYAFNMTKMNTISIPPSVVSIGNYAFYKSTLTSIIISEDSNLESIGDYAFGNTNFKNINIPNSVKTVGKYAFYYSKIESIDIYPNVSLIEDFTFSYSFLKFIHFYSNLSYIGAYAFSSSQLISINIPSSVTYIGSHAFYNCQMLNTIDFLNIQLENISDYLLKNTDILSIEIPLSVTRIKKYAFSNCKKLRYINILSNSRLSIIEEKAFENIQITNFTIPSSLTEIDDFSFYQCVNLEKIEFQSNVHLTKLSPSAFIKTKILEISLPSSLLIFQDDFNYQNYYENMNYYEKPSFSFHDSSQLEIIGNNSFYKSNIVSINIPSSVIKIGSYAFSSEILTSVTFAANSKLKEIGEFAFAESNISSIMIPSSLKTIKKNAFFKCHFLNNISFSPNCELEIIEKDIIKGTSIRNFVIPKNIKALDYTLFQNSNEISFDLDPENKYFTMVNSVIYSKDFLEVLHFPSYKAECFINDSVKIIGDYSYYMCKMVRITIPQNVSLIKSYAFANCTNLENVEFSPLSKLTTINSNAFKGTNLNDIYLPDLVISFSQDAFDQNTTIHLSDYSQYSNLDFYTPSYLIIKIPIKINEIPESRFSHYSLLKEVIFPNNSELKIIGSHSFSNTGLEYVSIPASVEKISEYAFANCLNLTKLFFDINCQLKIVESYAFYNSNLENLTFPAQNYIIASYAFSNIISLKNVTFNNGYLMPYLYTYCFYSCSIQCLNIHSFFSRIDENAFYCDINYICTNEFMRLNYDIKVGMCGNLNSYNFTIPSNVTDILFPTNIFKNHYALTLIFEGSSVKLEPLTHNYRFKFNQKFKFKSKFPWGPSAYGIIPNNENESRVIVYKFVMDKNRRTIYDFIGDEESVLVFPVERIASHAFENSSIKFIFIDEHVRKIEYHAFYNCSELITVVFGSYEIDYISEGAFVCCPKLKCLSTFISEKYKCICNTIYRIEDDKNFETIIAYAPMSRDKHFEISSRIIGEASFMCSYNLESVFINYDSVRQINRYAFFNCSNLKTINFPMSVSSVYEFSFEECYSLQECLQIDNHLRSFLIMLTRSGIPHHCIRCINVIDDQSLVIRLSNLKSKLSLISLLNCRR